MKLKLYTIIHLVVVVALIGLNGLANTGMLYGTTVGQVSRQLDNMFTPASYAFSIWSLIFLGLIVYSGYSVFLSFTQKAYTASLHPQLLSTLIGLNIVCGLWVLLWLQASFGWSLAVMLVLLISLLGLVWNQHQVPKSSIFDWIKHTTIQLYGGWITVATIANATAYLVYLDIIPAHLHLWATIGMIIIAVLIFLYVLKQWDSRIFVAVSVWAFIAQAVKNWQEAPIVAYTAMIAALVVTVAIVLQSRLTSIKQKT